MKSIKSLIGMPVIIDGRKAGRVLRAHLTPDLHALDSVYISRGILGGRTIAAGDIRLIGDVALFADAVPKAHTPARTRLFRRIVDTDGTLLGAVTDAFVEEKTGAIACLEITHGFFDDMLIGRERISDFSVQSPEGDIIVKQTGAEGGLTDEERNVEGPDGGGDAGGVSSDDIRRDELADRTEMEPAGNAGRQSGEQ